MKSTLLISAALLVAACSGPERDQIADVEAEVMTIHDEVMPKMDKIMDLKSRLSQKIQHIDSLQNIGVTNNTMAEQRIAATDLNQKLNEADKLMMDWMHEYKGDSAKKLKESEAVAYFQKEKEKILTVKQTTLKSIQDAEAFLQ